jgi:amidase
MGDFQERSETAEAICSKAQRGVIEAIPEEWRIDVQKFEKNSDFRGVPEASGVLSAKQLEITGQNACQLLSQIHSGVLSAVEVAEAFCARAAIAHQMVNCLSAFFPDEALGVARHLDEAFAQTKKPVGPLHGLPICVKDMHDLRGKRTTFGYVSWYDNIAQQDASGVKVMKHSGAVIFGKTTMPQTGMALETWSNLWGRTLNPYNSRFGSGGSSGGDGSLVAMRGVPCAPLASDIGGSIRIPAAFNGLFGMRPSSDRVPKFGVQSTAPGQLSIKVSVGPNCHSMDDLKLLVRLILTHPTLPYEPTCIPGSWIDMPVVKDRLKIGVMSTDVIVDPHPPIQRALKETTEKLRAAGHEGTPTEYW